MRSVRQQDQLSRHARSPIHTAAAVAVALLILAGGVAATIWNIQDLTAGSDQPGDAGTAQFQPVSPEVRCSSVGTR
jgi:hypothetical protein